jgi:hypothetical protein
VADVRAAFERYEAALVAGDVATLNELFWNSTTSLRFGIADRQRGAAEIHNWRRRHGEVPAGRRLHTIDVLTVDRHTAIVTALFDYPGQPTEGRQTQVWVSLHRGLADRLRARIRGTRAREGESASPPIDERTLTGSWGALVPELHSRVVRLA